MSYTDPFIEQYSTLVRAGFVRPEVEAYDRDPYGAMKREVKRDVFGYRAFFYRDVVYCRAELQKDLDAAAKRSPLYGKCC